jgi:hypothetical protein
MDLNTAYLIMMAFANRLRMPGAMHKGAENVWTVSIQPPGQAEIVITTIEAGRALYRELAAITPAGI